MFLRHMLVGFTMFGIYNCHSGDWKQVAACAFVLFFTAVAILDTKE